MIKRDVAGQAARARTGSYATSWRDRPRRSRPGRALRRGSHFPGCPFPVRPAPPATRSPRRSPCPALPAGSNSVRATGLPPTGGKRPLPQHGDPMNPTTVAHLRLSALRRTYTDYELLRGRDEYGHECWQARLRVEITQAMRDAGIVEVVQRSDYISLAYELHRQAVTLHPFRVVHLNPRPRAHAL